MIKLRTIIRVVVTLLKTMAINQEIHILIIKLLNVFYKYFII
jgi:hypothetical protein